MKNFFLLLVAVLLIQKASAQCGTIVTTQNVTCNGYCDGNIVFTSFGGTSPWTLTVDGIPYLVVADTNVAGNCPGTHHWVLTDAIASCTDSGDVMITEPTVLIAYDSTFTNATCNGLNNGVACATTNFGGTPPYFFLWANGDTAQCTSGLLAGFYSVTVIDANGCTADTGAFVFEPAVLTLSFTSITDVTCNGGNNGSAIVIASGGAAGYNYVWSDSSIVVDSVTAMGISAGNYSVVVTDANGCSTTQNFTITEPPPVITSVIPDPTICIGGSIQLYVNGGVSYTWSPATGLSATNISNPFASPGTTTTYTVTVTDIGGCTGTAIVTVYIDPPMSITINSIPSSCGQCDGSATAIVTGGTSPYAYLWSSLGIFSQVVTGVCIGDYTFIVTDMNGCIDSMNLTFPAQCDSVWPGDANLDGVADNNDVLALGIAYGTTGATRPGATNVWTGQTCLNWNNELINGTNYKHSDCDGNGIVDADDTLAVSLNYGLTHLRPNPPLHNASIPDLYLEALVDTTGPNQLLFVKIHLGTSVAPVPAVYGLAFTLTFDQTLIDTTTASFDYSTSALGTIGSDLLSFQHSFYSGGSIDVAVTRTNQTDVLNVDSVIGIFEVVITDNVSAVDQLRFDIANVTAMTHAQSSFSLNAIGDSVTVDPAFVGIPVINLGTLITVYPSPVKDHLKINSLIEVERAEMFNELGETIIAQPVHQKNFSFDMSGIKNGMYFLQLTTSQGLVRKKVCVMK